MSRVPTVVELVRRSKGLTQRELADAAGVSRETVSLIERRRSVVRRDTAERLAAALDYENPGVLFPDVFEAGRG